MSSDGLVALTNTARKAWPTVVVEPARLAAEIERRLGPEGAGERANLHHDIWLAVACGDGDVAAVALVDELVALECGIAARRLAASPVQAAELTAEVRRIVFVDEPPRTAAIRLFTGRGDLRGYLRVVAARTLVRIVQRDRREVPTDDDTLAVLGPALASSLDPDVMLLRNRHRADLDEALRAAIAQLSTRSRALLRFHLIDGWSIDRIGERYGVHRSTASRWVADARREVGNALRDGLTERLAMTRSQVDSLILVLTSGVDISLEQLLQ